MSSKKGNNKVLKHPLKEDIIKKLLNGESLRSVEEWLKTKFPKSPTQLPIAHYYTQQVQNGTLNAFNALCVINY